MNHVRITLAVFCLASFLGGFLSSLDAESVRRVEESTAPLQVFPMGMMDSVRRTSGAVPMQVQVYNSGSEVHALNPVSYTHLTLPTICSV